MSRVPIDAAWLAARILSLVGIVVSFSLSAEIPAQDVNTSATARAKQSALAGHTEEAVRILQEALASDPSDLDARLALGDIYARNGQTDEAEEEFREALRKTPESPAVELALGTLYLSAGKLEAAEAVLDDAVKNHPKLTEAHAQLAMVLARERKYAGAETHIRLVPPPADRSERVRYFRLVASIQSGLGESRAAARSMEDALHLKPADQQLQLVTAVAEAKAEEWNACIRNIAPLYNSHPDLDTGLLLLRAQLATKANFTATLDSLRKLDVPDDRKLELRVRCAEILAAANQHAEAVDELQEALKIAGKGDETLLYNLALEEYGAGQVDKSLAVLKSLRAQKDSAEVEDLIGDVEEQKGDLPAAILSHESAIAQAPGEERYRLSLGAELLQHQAYERAVSTFQQAAASFPDSARIYVGLGMAYYFLEKYEDSVSAFLRAGTLDGDSGRALGYLGATQMDNAAGPSPAAVDAICRRADARKPEQAMVVWCSALLFRKTYLAGNKSAASDVISRLRLAAKLAPGDPTASCSLGRALEWTEQLADARHWLEICVRFRPGSAEDHYRLSRVYRGLGLKQAAAKETELTDKANAAKDQRQAMADQFAHEMLGPSKSDTDPK